MPQRAHFRAFERREVSLPATVSTDFEPNLPARLANIGLGGVCCDLPRALDVGDRVTVEVVTPTLWDPLLIVGHVAWSQSSDRGSFRVGIRFEHKRESVLRSLLELLAAEGFD